MLAQPISTDLAVAATRVRQRPAPVLIPDTCALLDIVRIATRADTTPAVRDALGAAVRIRTAAQAIPARVWVVVPLIVHEEYRRNLSSVRTSVERPWRQVVQQLALVSEAAEALSVRARPTRSDYDDEFLPTLAAAEHLADAIRTCAITLDDDDACRLLADSRNRRRDAPSQTGDQAGDCTIIEHALEFARRVLPTSCPMVFLSSNTKDYYRDSRIPEPLATEMRQAGLHFTSTWPWAARELGV